MPCISQSQSYIQGLIDKTKLAIDEAMTAEAGLMAGTVQSYTLDTSQSRQTVTKFNITELRNYIDSLLNRLATLETRVYGCGVTTVRPCW